MTSEGRLCLGLVDVKRYGVPYFVDECIKTAEQFAEHFCCDAD